MRYRELERQVTEHVKCKRCDAEPGSPCMTRTGRKATDVHAARINWVWTLLNREYTQGYESGKHDNETDCSCELCESWA